MVEALDCGSSNSKFESYPTPHASIAPMVEHRIPNPGVGGSSPSRRAMKVWKSQGKKDNHFWAFYYFCKRQGDDLQLIKKKTHYILINYSV